MAQWSFVHMSKSMHGGNCYSPLHLAVTLQKCIKYKHSISGKSATIHDTIVEFNLYPAYTLKY